MKTWRKNLLAGAALVGATAFVTSEAVRSGQDQPKGNPPAQEMDPAMAAKMMELATPGKEHERIARRAGTWETENRFRMGPDAPWADAKGTTEGKLLLGGRYLLETVKFEMMGMPMEGLHLLGYDKMSQTYISLWADSMSTWWITSSGKADASGAVELKGTMVDVAGKRPFRMVMREKEDGTLEEDMYDTIPPAGEVKMMTIVSRRKKGG